MTMPTRRVQVGDIEQIITTQWLKDANGETHECVTLETPKAPSDTQRLRLQTAKDLGKKWRS